MQKMWKNLYILSIIECCICMAGLPEGHAVVAVHGAAAARLGSRGGRRPAGTCLERRGIRARLDETRGTGSSLINLFTCFPLKPKSGNWNWNLNVPRNNF